MNKIKLLLVLSLNMNASEEIIKIGASIGTTLGVNNLLNISENKELEIKEEHEDINTYEQITEIINKNDFSEDTFENLNIEVFEYIHFDDSSNNKYLSIKDQKHHIDIQEYAEYKCGYSKDFTKYKTNNNDNELILEVFKKLEFYYIENEKRPIILCFRHKIEPKIFHDGKFKQYKKKLNIYTYIISEKLPTREYYNLNNYEDNNRYIFRLVNVIKKIVKENKQFDKIFFTDSLDGSKEGFFYLNLYLKEYMPHVLIARR
jgi:hypothetical protein